MLQKTVTQQIVIRFELDQAPANAHDCSGKQPRVAHAGQFGLVRQSSLRAVIHVGGHCCKGGSCGLADGVWTDDSSRLLQQLRRGREV